MTEHDDTTCPYPDEPCTHECVREAPGLTCLLHPGEQERCPAESLIETAGGAFWLTCCLEIGHSGEHYGRPLSWGDDDA